jgi:hypothetical protein
MDALGCVTVAKEGEGIATKQLGNFDLSVLPTFPEPRLMDILAEAERVAGHVLGVRRH